MNININNSVFLFVGRFVGLVVRQVTPHRDEFVGVFGAGLECSALRVPPML